MAPLHKSTQCQVVVAHVSERVAAIVLACMHQALMFKQMVDDLKGIRPLEICKGLD